MSENPGTLTLWSLPRKSHFRVVHNTKGEINLSTTVVYRLVSNMADSGKTIVIEEAVPLAQGPQRYAYRLDAPIRIPRESAKTIAVYRVR